MKPRSNQPGARENTASSRQHASRLATDTNSNAICVEENPQTRTSSPIRAAELVALIQTPHRFRTKRQLWNYSGLALETHDSAQYCYVDGQLRRSKKPQQLRGLNQDHNHDLKNIFKGAAIMASISAGPFHDFYEALLAKGAKPTMARLTLARKIAAITLSVWKKGASFDAKHLRQQAA